MRHASSIVPVLSLLVLPWLGAPAVAQNGAIDAEITPERIAACSEDRIAEGCATILVRLMVCEQAPVIAGCEEVNARAEEVAAETENAESEVEPRAEGELADDESASPPLQDNPEDDD